MFYYNNNHLSIVPIMPANLRVCQLMVDAQNMIKSQKPILNRMYCNPYGLFQKSIIL